MMLIYTLISIPYNSMIGVVTPDHGERSSLSSYKFIFAYLSGITVQVLVIPMVHSLGAGNVARGYQISMAIFGSIAVLLFPVTFRFSKERVQLPADQKTSVSQDIKDLLGNRPWVILFLVSLASLVYIAIRCAVVAYTKKLLKH
jgi:glycoside/pentoside/hexuronide:cation symporter, GPH family